ncbi:Glyoxylase, beta-lactamase superfamily II [Paenibacillaceae bacterium GAS479]|nr:Glyoxylase, beta-lactamase superfamily II [Paenibacillaceae bacterium GAS479]
MNYTIKPILTGYQLLDKGNYATFRQGNGEIVEFPVFCFLVEGGDKKILVDTGMSDTEHSIKYHHDGRQDPGQAIHEQLASMGISTDEIELIIFTHLHWDHCFNLHHFPNAKLVASRIEHEFAVNPIPFYWNSYEYPEATGLTPPFAGRDFDLVEGDADIIEGISVFPTPGHSPGHMAVSVQTEKGKYVIVGDLMFVRENMEPDKKHGWPLTPPGRFANVIELWHSMEEAIKRSDYILMSHDPEQMGVKQYP